MNLGNFLTELKRRNVYKVAIAYGVVAWLLIQVTDTVFPRLNLPDWAVTLVIVLVLLGFPVALVLAWAFELAPEGVVRAEDVVPNKSITRKTGRKLTVVIVLVGALAAAMFAFQFVQPKASSTVREGRAAISEKSIAVLTFENLSEEKANAYFAEGIQEEILTRLAKIGALKVISGSSLRQSSGQPGPLSEVGRQLGVANILKGSVQKAGDQVRVHVQLIQAATAAQLWGEIYDRKLTDIFQVESEIAKAIAETLQAKLTGSEEQALTARPTENSEAHQLYLRGRYFWNKRTGDNLRKAVEYFQQAIAADPKYALAYAGLADAYVLHPAYGVASPGESFPKAKAAAQKAVELDDSSAEAHASLGKVLWNSDFDFPQSLSEFERAIALNPRYATAHHWYGNSPLLSLGRFDEAVAEMRRALELDPLSLILNADLGNTYHTARRYDESIAQLHRTLEMDPGFYYAHLNLGQALELNGDRPAAIEEYQKARELNNDPMVLAQLGHAYGTAGRIDEAAQILNQLGDEAKQRYVPKYAFALVELGLGRNEQALGLLETSFQDREARAIAYIKVDPFLDPLRGEPRFKELVAQVFAKAKDESPRQTRSP